MKSTVVWNPLQLVGPSQSVLVYSLHSLEKQYLGLTRYTAVAPNMYVSTVQARFSRLPIIATVRLSQRLFFTLQDLQSLEFMKNDFLFRDFYHILSFFKYDCNVYNQKTEIPVFYLCF